MEIMRRDLTQAKLTTVFYLLPSNQEEIYRCQVDAQLLTQAHQQVPDGYAGPQRDRATWAVRQADVALPQGGSAATASSSSSALSWHGQRATWNVTLREVEGDDGWRGVQGIFNIRHEVIFRPVFLKCGPRPTFGQQVVLIGSQLHGYFPLLINNNTKCWPFICREDNPIQYFQQFILQTWN